MSDKLIEELNTCKAICGTEAKFYSRFRDGVHANMPSKFAIIDGALDKAIAALSAKPEPIPRPGCMYLSEPNIPCTKCGEPHTINALVQMVIAAKPEPECACTCELGSGFPICDKRAAIADFMGVEVCTNITSIGTACAHSAVCHTKPKPEPAKPMAERVELIESEIGTCKEPLQVEPIPKWKQFEAARVEEWIADYTQPFEDCNEYMRTAVELDDLRKLFAEHEAQLAEKVAEIERTFQMLEANGVGRARARSPSNGVDVLATRLSRDIRFLQADLALVKEKFRQADECAHTREIEILRLLRENKEAEAKGRREALAGVATICSEYVGREQWGLTTDDYREGYRDAARHIGIESARAAQEK